MSLIFCDGFDDGLLVSKWDWSAAGATADTAAKRNGTYGLQILGINAIGRRIPVSQRTATMTLGFAVQGANTIGSGTLDGVCSFYGDDGATRHVTVAFDGNAIRVYRGGYGVTLLGSYVLTLTTGLWYYLETKVTISDTVGAVEVRLNGSTIINLTGIDTKNGGTGSTIDVFTLGGGGSYPSVFYFDDLYLCNDAGSVNTGFLGDIAVETLFPNGNGASSQFTGSDGDSTNNYLLVNENPPVTTNYVEDLTTTQKDTYAYSNLVRTSGTIYGAQAVAYAQAADSGARSVSNIALSSATQNTKTAQPVVTTYAAKTDVFEIDPATGVAWTIAGLNAAEFGVQVA